MNRSYQETSSVAAYGQGTLDLGLRTKLTIGARYTNEQRGIDGLQMGYLNGVVPVTLAKGLEYDHVIVVEPASIARAEARGLQRLYVAFTRAVSRLTVLYTEPLPAPLRS